MPLLLLCATSWNLFLFHEDKATPISLFPVPGRKFQLLQPSAMGGCMESCPGQKEASPGEVKDSSRKFIPTQGGSWKSFIPTEVFLHPLSTIIVMISTLDPQLSWSFCSWTDSNKKHPRKKNDTKTSRCEPWPLHHMNCENNKKFSHIPSVCSFTNYGIHQLFSRHCIC